jgi:hypothetical protein
LPKRSFRLLRPAFYLNCLKLWVVCGSASGPVAEFWPLGLSASEDFFWLKSRRGDGLTGKCSTERPIASGGDEDETLLWWRASRRGFF